MSPTKTKAAIKAGVSAVTTTSTPRPAGTLRAILRTARPRQWLKNILVFAAPGAAGVLTHQDGLLRTLAAFGLFAAVSSGVYFVNDIFDIEADRAHPTKCQRPLPSGQLGIPTAWTVAITLLVAGLALGTLLRPLLGLVLAIYIAIQATYSMYLKHQPVYDLVTVASGFVIRAIAGAVAAHVAISEWFLIVTSFGSLMMVTGKRIAEHDELGEARGSHRATLELYSREFLLVVLAVSAIGGILGYALWAFSLQTDIEHHHRALWCQLSIIPVLIGMLRYAWLVDRGHGAKPEKLVMSDRPLLLLGVVWVILFALVTYAT